MFLMSLLTASIVKNKKFFKKNIDQTSKVFNTKFEPQ